MPTHTINETRARAEAKHLWERLLHGSACIAELIPVPVQQIVRSILHLRLEEPEEIIGSRPGFETAGEMDRANKRIVVAQKYPYEWRRFTIAHEIAHWVLHPDVTYHRDRPLDGGEQANAARAPEEQEADKFASELLMPSEILMGRFGIILGKPIDGEDPTLELASRLVGNRTIDPVKFASYRRYRSLVVAQTPLFRNGRCFPALAKQFVVSPTAMAIQLEDLHLVL